MIAKKIKNIKKEEAINDYKKLREVIKINQNSNIGNKALDYLFFKHRIKTKSIKGISFLDFYKSDKYKETPSYLRLYEYAKNNEGLNHYQSLYRIFNLYFGSINNFKPIIAKKLYLKLKPTTILDVSCGWGGRCLAAMSLDINYIGFDTNINLKNAYKKMFELYESNSNIDIYFSDSSKYDFSKFDYDMFFTSPPYYNKKLIEEYEFMPKYDSEEDFYNKFLFPVITNSYTNLKKNGYFCLNIPSNMYKEVKKILGKYDSIMRLNLTRRRDDIKYKEYIYIWKKL